MKSLKNTWWSMPLLAAALVCGLLVSPVSAQNAAAGRAAAADEESQDGVRDLILPAGDGWPIHCTYYESSAGRESACVILLTSTAGSDDANARNRRVWQATAVDLQKAGFAVVTVDLRKHGDSVPVGADGNPLPVRMVTADYPMMASGDLGAVKAFLLAEHQRGALNVRKLGIVSMGASSMVAAAFAIEDWAQKPYPDAPTLDQRTPRGQDVRAIMMYSPTTDVRGIRATTILRTLKTLPIPVYTIVGAENKADAVEADKVFKSVELKGEQFEDSRKIVEAPLKAHAEEFLQGRLAAASQKDIKEFLTKYVVDLEFPWVDRTDRRTR